MESPSFSANNNPFVEKQDTEIEKEETLSSLFRDHVSDEEQESRVLTPSTYLTIFRELSNNQTTSARNIDLQEYMKKLGYTVSSKQPPEFGNSNITLH